MTAAVTPFSVMAPDRLETARLRAEPLGPAHRDGLATMLGDPRVGATLGGPATPDQVDRHGFGWYAWLDRDAGTLVARGGPRCARIAGHDEVEIGWTVVPERWNQGLATELGAASLEVVFGPLDLADVVSLTLPHNHASRRVMEKLNFAYERDTDYKGWPHVLYRKGAA
jgi:ribosomal-protein-alanine N-acetyltransferase